MANTRLQSHPGGQCRGEITLPGDKSISHRAIILASLAEGDSHITGFLPGEDCLATVNVMRAMGVKIAAISADHYLVHGVGMRGLTAPKTELDCGNAGTLIRLIAGVLVGQSFSSRLTGDASLRQRPMGRIVNPLREMGANIEASDSGSPPLTIKPSTNLQGIHYRLPVASAQVKSCCLLAGLFAEGETVISEEWPTRDHSERLLAYLDYPIEVKQHSLQPYRREIHLMGQGSLRARDIQVPADISHAAFLLVAAAITPNAQLRLVDVGVNPTRIGILHLLKEMGADLELHAARDCGGEPVATIQINYSQLRGITVPEAWVPLAIDEFPVFAVAATFAQGETVIRGAEELRFKESDRIEAVVNGINALGGQAESLPDGMIIQGLPLQGGRVDAVGDHRIAMAFAAASGAVAQPIVIDNAAAIATSWPNFIEVLQQVGLTIEWEK